MTEVISLTTCFEDTVYKLNEHFHVTMNEEVTVYDLNPYFLVTYQNIIECMFQWIEDFTRLGIALRSIRNVEILQ